MKVQENINILLKRNLKKMQIRKTLAAHPIPKKKQKIIKNRRIKVKILNQRTQVKNLKRKIQVRVDRAVLQSLASQIKLQKLKIAKRQNQNQEKTPQRKI